MDHAKLIVAFTQYRLSHADQRLQNPSVGADMSFDYGRACGVNQGLRIAEKLVQDMVAEENEKDI